MAADPATGSSTGTRAAESAPAAGRDLFLLLTNGQVLHGRVTVDGDRYLLVLPRADIRIPRGEVEFECSSLQEGFRLKRAAVADLNGDEHLSLAHWCLEQGLYDEAEGELRRATQLDPRQPRLELLRRQLKLAREPVAHPPKPPSMDPLPVPDAELDALVRSLPGPAVETFSRTVEPLLLSSCAAAGCHGPATKSDFHLLRLTRGQTLTRRVTQRNLHAVLAWVDAKAPQKSRLLSAATEAHGGATAPIFKRTDAAPYRYLARWVEEVASPRDSAGPETLEALDESDATLSQSVAEPKRLPEKRAEQPRSARVLFPMNPADRPRRTQDARRLNSRSESPPRGPTEKPPEIRGSLDSREPLEPERSTRRNDPDAPVQRSP